MNKLEVGMYARTLDGIVKITEIRENDSMCRFIAEDGNVYFYDDMLCDPSFNVTDLLEYRDVVLCDYYPIDDKDIVHADDKLLYLKVDSLFNLKTYPKIKIKRILTKEQFEKESYKLGDD